MIICNSPSLRTSVFKCPKCNNTKFVYNTCKSRFCNSCGIKYAKQRALNIEYKLIIFQLISRLIRHIPDTQFKTIRYYGFYASKSHNYVPLVED